MPINNRKRSNKYEFYSDANFTVSVADYALRGGYYDFFFVHERENGIMYFLKSSSKRFAAQGLKLYSDKKKVRALVKEGEKIKKTADRTMTKEILAEFPNMTDLEIRKLVARHFKEMEKFAHVYNQSEVFYTGSVDKIIKDFVEKKTVDQDEASRFYALILTPASNAKIKAEQKKAFDKIGVSEHIRTLCDSVRFLGRSRIFLHEILNGNYMFMKAAFAEIAKRKNFELRQLEACHVEEILALLDGKLNDLTEINRRMDAYVAFCRGKKPYFYSGPKARKLIAEIRETMPENIREIFGNPASAGKVTGRVIIMPGLFSNGGKDFREKMKLMKKGEILVANATGPEMIVACRMASAIIANEGGINSHAAIVSRELGIPAIVGTKIATRVLRDGDLVEVDAIKGVIRILSQH